MTAHARIKCTIWQDVDFRDLTVDAQWMYQRLLSDSGCNLAGVLALTRKRWVASAAGMTMERLDAALDELSEATFVVIDEDTEEVLVRTYIRHNGVSSQPNVLKAALKQVAKVESPLLRAALAHELRLLPEKPADTARMTYPDPHAVAEAVDPGPLGARLSVVREAPPESEVSAGSAHQPKGSPNPSGNPSKKGSPKGAELERSKTVATTPARGRASIPAQSVVVQPPLIAEVVESKPDKTRGTRLDEKWRPNESTAAWTREQAHLTGLNVYTEWDKFQDYWLARAGAGARKVDWDRTWRSWVRKATEDHQRRSGRSPSGLTPKDQKIANIVAMGRQMQAAASATQQKALEW